MIDPDLDFTAFAEPEDHDLGLMVSNVLSDPAWLERVRTDGG